jgi:hypothetical protein
MYHSELEEPVEPAYLTKYPSQKISLYEGEVQCFYEENGTTH